jgi:uroporphyrinogen decarboxylase
MHSYEDCIEPVEKAYTHWGPRIAIVGGIDVDVMVRATPAAIHQRALGLLALSAKRGGYALGTGNSVPPYIPDENFFAMISAAVGGR